MSIKNSHTHTLNLPFPMTYELEQAPDSKHGLLVLHGYSDRASSARKRLLGTESVPSHVVLAPNAIFPAPAKIQDHYKEAYAWYFRDPHSGKQMISPDFAAKALIQLIHELKLDSIQWTILGFSQGGFFAPHLIRQGLRAKTIIAAGAAYRAEAYEGLPPTKVYAIHGAKDEVVPLQLSQSSFEVIKKMGYGADYHLIPDLGHTLNDESRKLIRTIIQGS